MEYFQGVIPRFNRGIFLFVVALILPFFVFAERSLPFLTGPVVDEIGVLNGQQKSDIDIALRNFYSKTQNQIQLVIINSLEGEVLEDFSIRLAEKWKIGSRSQGSGVILLVAFKEKKIRIEVGDGLEGILTDYRASHIIQDDMVPLFKQGNYAGGVAQGLSSIAEVLGGKLSTTRKFYTRRSGGWIGNLFYLFFWIFLIIPFLFGRKRRSGYLAAFLLGNILGGGGRGGGYGGGGWSGGGGGFSGGGAGGGW
ncbi:MAG: TPM domain-containing protein [Deltaproteobacteria bacterium]|nr:TPM domain-containing protein [Deltaproteobacteria bacterium]